MKAQTAGTNKISESVQNLYQDIVEVDSASEIPPLEPNRPRAWDYGDGVVYLREKEQVDAYHRSGRFGATKLLNGVGRDPDFSDIQDGLESKLDSQGTL